jgi:hypothetical protein
MRQRFLTPSTSQLTGVSVRRFFCVDSGLAHFLTGCLDQLTDSYNWEKFGDIEPDAVAQLFEEVIASMGNCDMVGQVIATLGNVPDNCLLMDGKSVLVSDYPLLAGAVPDLVSGSNIVLPDMTDAYLVGGDNFDVGTFTGSNTHTLTESEMPAHTHDYVSAASSLTTIVVPDEPSAIPAPAISSPSGGNQPHNNMPYSMSVFWCIVAK